MNPSKKISKQFIAHRGWQKNYPENTAIAIEKAIEAGASNIEIDIQLTKDHSPYLSHDNHLLRVCEHNQKITEMHSIDLTKLSAHEPTRFNREFFNTPLCNLQQCVDLISNYSDVTLFAEIKDHSINEFGTQICLDSILPILTPIEKRCVIISFNTDILLHAKKIGWKRLGLVLNNWDQAFSQEVIDLSPELFFCDKNILTTTRTPTNLPKPCAVYEVGDITQAKELLSNGAQWIETFCIGELINDS